MKAQTNFFDELIVDNFAGGGGASTGMELALSRPVDIAVNHDPDAVAMHRANHPYTKHYCESVWDVDPVAVCAGRPVGLAWFSPDCKHFSKAKGGKPVSKNIRGLAWVVLRWAAKVKPRVIMLENVEEFKTWGPLKALRDKKTGRIIKKIEYVSEYNPITNEMEERPKNVIAERGEVVPFEKQILVPDKKRSGETFRRWKEQLEALGYQVEMRELRACDYGAPTIRKRFFVIARRDGQPIVWPEPTHGDPKSEAVRTGKLKPWRTAAEIIDWLLPCPSIFDSAEEIYNTYGLRAQRPLAEATMRRIARGIQKFVVDNPEPFIVQVNHGGGFRGQSADAPLQTVTAKHGYSVVTPVITSIGQTGFSADRSRSISDPLNTTVSKAEQCLIAPTLVELQHQNEGFSAESPLHTIKTVNHQFLATPTLIQYHGEKSNHEVRGQSLESPIMTVDGSGRYAMVSAFLSKYYAGGHKGYSNSVEDPLNTITSVDHNAIITANLVKFQQNSIGQDPETPLHTCMTATRFGVVTSNLCILRNHCTGQEVTEPLHTIATSPGHFAEVRAFLVKYYGQGSGQSLAEPLHTATAQDRFGLVTISGIDYAIVDIGLRMLTPCELFAANGFPPDYIINKDDTGKEYPKSKQVARCGIAVPPQFAEALVRANLPELCGGKITTMAELESQVAI